MSKVEKIRLLVIEDDEDLCEVVAEYFRPRGYRIELQHDALGPLARLRKTAISECPWDIILTDLKMPGIDGLEFIREVKNLAPTLPVVLMTAHGGVETAVEAVKVGAYDFVTKPLKFPELTVTLERAAGHRKLQEENLSLRAALKDTSGPSGIIAKSRGMKAVIDLARRVSNSTATVLISGESGTGKEVVARTIHDSGNRKEGPFVAINCAAIPETLLESELFGFSKGAFTGAVDHKIGLFEEANGGTLFLDEIGDLSGGLQAKLLRVLQERQIKRLGENQVREIDVRVIAATHKNLSEEVEAKRFREDLFFRLNVIPIHIPPLRERVEDILPLAQHFLRKFCIANQSSVQGFAKEAMEELTRLPWKGNVRELENTIERAVVLCQANEIGKSDLTVFSRSAYQTAETPSSTPTSEKIPLVETMDQPSEEQTDFTGMLLGSLNNTPEDSLPKLSDVELQYIQWVVERVGGVREKARKILDIDRKTLYKKINQLQTKVSDSGSDSNIESATSFSN